MRDYYLPIAVEDETGWKKVERFVERWMRNYKHDIKVKLVIVYKKTKRTDGASSDEEDMRSKKVYASKVALIFSVASFRVDEQAGHLEERVGMLWLLGGIVGGAISEKHGFVIFDSIGAQNWRCA
jgi:hypothetical protein